MSQASLDLGRLAPPPPDAARLARGEHHDPHSILGRHAVEGGAVVRAFHPEATAGTLTSRQGAHEMRDVGSGIWATFVPDVDATSFAYRLRFGFPTGEEWEHD